MSRAALASCISPTQCAMPRRVQPMRRAKSMISWTRVALQYPAASVLADSTAMRRSCGSDRYARSTSASSSGSAGMGQNAGGSFVSGAAVQALTPHRTQLGPSYSDMASLVSRERPGPPPGRRFRVDAARWDPAVEIGCDVLDDLAEEDPVRLLGDVPEVRRENGVVEPEQWMVRRQRLYVVHIQPDPGDPPLGEDRNERRF